MNDSDINSIEIESFEVNISNSKIQRVLDKILKENVFRGPASIGFRFLVRIQKLNIIIQILANNLFSFFLFANLHFSNNYLFILRFSTKEVFKSFNECFYD
ncbi:hypothetical protein BpHYR1_052603 [Brachionus plicatilis]|uniref:Uncharacterized protein n=1 Tax=Brachionus plicatilis TaxID=10195 RepID=A0A3M7PT20_BRAPC|nr:hypothetical protein BpHYR1_052603 [Brachionus plicatilis]